MTLHTKILQQAREELAKKRGWNSYEHRTQYYKGEPKENTIEFEKEAALLAMEKQAEFFKFIMSDFMYDKRLDCYLSLKEMLKSYSELELYEIFTTQQ